MVGNKTLHGLATSKMDRSKTDWFWNCRNLDSWSSTMKPVEGISARLNTTLFFISSGDKPQELRWLRWFFFSIILNIKSNLDIFSCCIFTLQIFLCTLPERIETLLKACCNKIFCLRAANRPLHQWDKYPNSFCFNWLPWSSCLFLPGLTSFDTLHCSSL